MADNTKFRFHSNFRPDAAFQSVKFGYDSPILETELNEMQQLQEEARKSLIRRLVPSGFIELVSKEFTGDAIIYNPIDKATMKLNHIALAPSRAMVNGSEISLEGNFAINGFNNYILVDLGEAPASGVREDLVYLEVWYETLSEGSSVTKWGYQKGTEIGYPMVDTRVAQETSRRVAVKWDIKIAQGLRFDLFPDGFGYENVNKFSSVQGSARGQLGFDYNPKLIFAGASDAMFKGCEFFKDTNLWVAGRPNYTFPTSNIFGNYIFALPLFRVRRRNKQTYTIENFNGASTHAISSSALNSSYYGDLASGFRPDGLTYDYIVPEDLIDLRRTVSVKEFSSDHYMNKGLKSLFTGSLQTKETKKMRRVQFGKKKMVYADNANLIFAATFNGRTPQAETLPTSTTPAYEVLGNAPVYKDSVGGYGLWLDGTTAIKYGAAGINMDKGTIDFFMQPYWDGSDPDVNQTILTLVDPNNNPIFTFEKKTISGSPKLVWSQYTNTLGAGGVVNQVVVDLTSKLLFAKNIYHVRLSWKNADRINRSFIYINGNLAGDAMYSSTALSPSKLQIGKLETVDSHDNGFVIEELLIYKTGFEENVNSGTYSYVANKYWPNLPPDFMQGSALLYPSFNSMLRTFEDNGGDQALVKKIHTDAAGTGAFTLRCPAEKQIVGSVAVYPVLGDKDGDRDVDTLTGTWLDLADGSRQFTCIDTTLNDVIMKFTLRSLPGCGGLDLPNEMLAAAIVTSDNAAETGNETNHKLREVSFCRRNADEPRVAAYFNPNRVSADVDTLYDLKTDRGETECYARLLEYHRSGDGTNQYIIPSRLYGYEVIGIMEAVGRKITRIKRIPDSGSTAGQYILTLRDNVLLGDVLTLKVALGGMTFDYETHTKTIVSNIHKTKMLEFTADGTRNTYVIPCYDDLGNGGIVKSVFSITQNIFGDPEDSTKVTDKVVSHACYLDNEMFAMLPELGSDGNLTGNYVNQLARFTISNDSLGSPFLTVSFFWVPAAGTKITIPVLVSHQPSDDEILSVWYNYVPYQGILSNKTKSLKRVSDWRYFITTLSSGALALTPEEDNIYSLNNIINRLPGGAAYAYIVDGQPIDFSHLKASFRSDCNPQLFFMKDVIYASEGNDLDSSFFELTTDFSVRKTTVGYQDERNDEDKFWFKLYFPDTETAITKYTGMACLVMDEDGELLLFVAGCLNNGLIEGDKTKDNLLIPHYVDLFKIPGLPTTVRQY